MKYSQWIGVLASLTLMASCFMAWTYYPDLNKNFTGFFSEQNIYGKPGKYFVFFSSIAIVFFLLPKVWAKRWNFLITALIVAFAIRCYIIFTGCYNVYCPEKKAGIWVMLISSIIMLVMSFLPPLEIKPKNNS